MKYAKDKLNLEEGTKRDWIITNGLGGYASSTIIGANTRKYHGLLVAPLTPPARRYLILSKIDESIETNGKKYNLYTNPSLQFELPEAVESATITGIDLIYESELKIKN